ncbi:MAG: MATE family efflux transporter [Paracoccaceae bacterium]
MTLTLPDPAAVASPARPRAFLAAVAVEVRRLARLAAPIVAGLVAATGIMLVDTAMIGPLGAVPLGAAALTTSVLIVFYAGLYGFAGPVGLFAGRAFGAGDAPRIGRVARHGAALALLGGALGTAAMAAGLFVLPALGQPEAVVAAVGPYWLWMAAGLVPFTLACAAKALFDATDRPWTGVALALPPIALNAVLDWLLIYGHWGLPALGLAGAGIASLVAQSLGAALLWGYARFAPELAAWWPPARPTLAGLREQAREGLPMAGQYLLEGGAVAVAGLLVGGFGAAALAGNQIALSLGATLYMLPLGIAAAVTIRVAQAVGANETGRAGAIGVAGLGVVTLWMSLSAVAYVVAGEAIARAFVDDPAVIGAAASILFVFGLTQVMDGIQSVSLGALRGLLDNRWPTLVSLVCYWVIALPLGWLLAYPLGLGAPGVWAGFGVGLVFAATALSWRLRRRLATRTPVSPPPAEPLVGRA